MRQAVADWQKRRHDHGSVWPEVMFSTYLVAWGIAFLNPFQSFALSINYALLSSIAPEEFWGVLLLSVGVAWLGIVVLGFTHLRLVAGVIGSGVLMWLAVSIFLSNPNSTWASPVTIVGAGAVYSSVRLITLWTHRAR